MDAAYTNAIRFHNHNLPAGVSLDEAADGAQCHADADEAFDELRRLAEVRRLDAVGMALGDLRRLRDRLDWIENH